ncbi:MAG: hypothetical protein SGI89_08935 [bacterium]|nr:hypothetical protein [bacterium]
MKTKNEIINPDVVKTSSQLRAEYQAATGGVKEAIAKGLTEEQYVKGQGTPLYHGTKSSISDISQSDVWQYGDPGALYGQGTYLTDSKSVAGGYAKTKGAGVEGKVLESFLKSDVKLLDLDKILTTQEYSIFSNVEKSIMNAYKLDGEVTKFSGMKGSEAYRALRETLAAAEIPKYEAGEWIDGLQQGFKEQGYHGFKHIGGIRGGEKSGVSIIFPNDTGVFPKELLQTSSQLRAEYQAATGGLIQKGKGKLQENVKELAKRVNAQVQDIFPVGDQDVQQIGKLKSSIPLTRQELSNGIDVAPQTSSLNKKMGQTSAQGAKGQTLGESIDPNTPYFNTQKLKVAPEVRKQVDFVVQEMAPTFEKFTGKRLSNREPDNMTNTTMKTKKGGEINMATLQYVEPTEEQKSIMQTFRNKYEALFNELKSLPASRGMSLAVTKLEESAMWLNKAITKND